MNTPLDEPPKRRFRARVLSAASPYAVAAAAVVVAMAIRLALDPVLHRHAPYLPFALSVMVAARHGGRLPGLAATALSAVAITHYLISPTGSLAVADPGAAAGMALFVVVGSLISLLVGHLRESLLATARAEEALRRQAQLIDLSHDAIITTDPQRRITGWNAGAEEMYGWNRNEAASQVIHEFLETSGSLSTEDVLRREGRWNGELSHRARDGRRLFVESRQVLLRGENDNPAGFLEINRDVTERKRAEDALREASEQRRLAFEAANLGSWQYHPDHRVYWDDRCARIFGSSGAGFRTRDEILLRIVPEDRAAVEGALEEALAGANGGAYDREYRIAWPDGSVHWVASHGRVYFEGEGEQRHFLRFLGVNMETTARRQADERLRQTQKLESIGVLAGGVAHDFNNLLTVIMGSASSALAECPACEHSQAILSASERAAYLTRQLLAYAGKGQFVVRTFDLADLVSRSTRLLSASVPKRVGLAFDLPNSLPLLEADPTRVEQVLMNLVINAGEAIPPKTDGRIEIAARECEVTDEMVRRRATAFDVRAGQYVCLEVRDNGTGMDEATAARIFEPFFSTKFTGRGLGLAAVHGVVRTSGGFIEVETAPGAGSTFRVFLPASRKERPAEPAVPAPKREEAPGAATILVVDDEELVRKLASMALRRHGYEVLEAQDGKEALEVIARSPSPPSLVLLDLAMPVMGGDELAPILHRKYPDVKIVMSSGYQEEEARKGFSSAAVAGFLQKPYTVMALLETIDEVLAARARH